MTREDVEALRALYAEWADSHFRNVDLFAPDVLFEPLPERTIVRGLAGLGEYMRDFVQQWSDFRIEAEDFAEFGDGVVVRERQFTTGVSSGVTLESTIYAAWTFRDGKVVRARWELDREAAREAIGLPG